MKEAVKITLKSGKDQSLRRFHPWVFSGAIKKIYGEPVDGDMVEVYSNHDEFLAMGHYQKGGSITVRVVSFKQTSADPGFWKARIDKAISFRRQAGIFDQPEETNVFRLVNAEGDGMPGLIIDFYNGTAVTQFHSIGMHRVRDEIVTGLKSSLGESLVAIYDKSEKTLPSDYASAQKDSYLYGEKQEGTVSEHGHRFHVDWSGGQKTGFFIDQRENRKILGSYARNRSILNLFGYTGGFSVYGISAGAAEVHTVDSSASAIKLADQNIRLNFGETVAHRGIVADAFEFLSENKERYDLIILDPPAFAKHQKVLHNALQGYKRLNARALEQIRPGGILFTFSCSQAVSRENFRKSVFAAAANAGRDVRILHQLTQPPDHPVSIYHPEGEYLKGLVLFVE